MGDPEHRVRVPVGEAVDDPCGRDVRSVHVHDPDVGNIDRQQLERADADTDLDRLAGSDGGGAPQPGEQCFGDRETDLHLERIDERGGRGVGVRQRGVPADPHHRMRVLIGEPVDRLDLTLEERGVRS